MKKFNEGQKVTWNGDPDNKFAYIVLGDCSDTNADGVEVYWMGSDNPYDVYIVSEYNWHSNYFGDYDYHVLVDELTADPVDVSYYQKMNDQHLVNDIISDLSMYSMAGEYFTVPAQLRRATSEESRTTVKRLYGEAYDELFVDVDNALEVLQSATRKLTTMLRTTQFVYNRSEIVEAKVKSEQE